MAKVNFLELVNDIYLNAAVVKQMKTAFKNTGVLRLDSFFNELKYKAIFDLFDSINGKKKKIADRFSFEEMNAHKIKKMFASKEFISFISSIIGKKFYKIKVEVRRFRHRDYTLVHDFNSRGIEFFMFFSKGWSDKLGGQLVYRDVDGKSLIFNVRGDSFVLINSRSYRKFVKYVNHLAGKRSFVLIEGKIITL